jgi:hypothetical protein
MFRLFIDIQIPGSEEEALKIAQQILNFGFDNHQSRSLLENGGVETVNYRLGHDSDRQKSNYFTKNANGHVNNKKSRIIIKTSETSIDSDEN